MQPVVDRGRKGGGHEGRFNRDPLQVFSAGGPCEQFWHGQGCPLYDAVHSAFPRPTTALPALQGALKDCFADCHGIFDMHEQCKLHGVLINVQLNFKQDLQGFPKPISLPFHPDVTVTEVCVKMSTFTNSSPIYIAQLLSIYTPSRYLHSSSDTHTLHIPFFKTQSFGQTAFSFTGPNQWNLLTYGL